MGKSRVLVTGAAGYVGSRLVPALLQKNFEVIAFDTFWYGITLPLENPDLLNIKGDLRNFQFESILEGVDYVIHLACISNDPSFELDPQFSESINVSGSQRLIDACLKFPIKRFVFASSSSVYGIKEEEIVHENLVTEPLTLYSQNKVDIENYLYQYVNSQFDYVILRPATLMGVSPRLRLDVVSHILTAQGFFDKKIRVHGGDQFRPQLHIDDMLRAYILCIETEKNFNGAIYNVGDKNYSVMEIARTVQEQMPHSVELIFEKVSDPRSYRISSEKIKVELGFETTKNLKNGILDLIGFFKQNPSIVWTDEKFHNVKRLKLILSQNSKSEVALG